MTNYLNKIKKQNPNAYVKLLDEKNYWDDAKILISNRDDSFYRLLLNLTNKWINLGKLTKLIETWHNNFKVELADSR